MLIGLFTLIFTVLLGSADSPFIIPEAEKAITQTITEKERKKEIKALLKSYNKEFKALKKYEKQTGKSIVQLIKDRSVTSASISEEFDKVMANREDFNRALTSGRLLIQEKINPDEWEEILNKIQDVKPKKLKKQNKSEIKSKLQLEKSVVAFKQEILDAFEEVSDQDAASKHLDQFEDNLSQLLFEEQHQKDKMIDVMYDGEASRADIEEVVKNFAEFQSNAQQSMLDLRSNLVDLSDEGNWPKLAKALAKFI